MKQKFKKLQFVRVCDSDKFPPYMSHFKGGFDAIILESGFQLDGGSKQEYALYEIQDGKIVDDLAWYEEEQLTLLSRQSRTKAEAMIEVYDEARYDE